MELEKYNTNDCPTLAELFYNTVHLVNWKDYSQKQLDAWADGKIDIAAWDKSFSQHNTLVAKINGTIAGFGNMDTGGHIDMLYIHHNYQRKGVATAIVNELERQAANRGVFIFTTHASITAKPFFEQRGYNTLKENTVVRRGVKLINYTMEKRIIK